MSQNVSYNFINNTVRINVKIPKMRKDIKLFSILSKISERDKLFPLGRYTLLNDKIWDNIFSDQEEKIGNMLHFKANLYIDHFNKLQDTVNMYENPYSDDDIIFNRYSIISDNFTKKDISFIDIVGRIMKAFDTKRKKYDDAVEICRNSMSYNRKQHTEILKKIRDCDRERLTNLFSQIDWVHVLRLNNYIRLISQYLAIYTKNRVKAYVSIILQINNEYGRILSVKSIDMYWYRYKFIDTNIMISPEDIYYKGYVKRYYMNNSKLSTIVNRKILSHLF